jgi:hypothetical protein
MRVFNRKSRLQRFLDTVTDSLDAATESVPGSLPSGKALKGAVPKEKAVKAGLIAGGIAGLTAGSAGISSLRRRQEGESDDS